MESKYIIYILLIFILLVVLLSWDSIIKKCTGGKPVQIDCNCDTSPKQNIPPNLNINPVLKEIDELELINIGNKKPKINIRNI